MNILMNNQNNLSVNTKMFKCVGLLVLLSTLTCVTLSRAMQEKRKEMVSQATSNELANKKLFEARTPEDVERALKAGADVNAKINFGWTPLLFVCFQGYNTEVALKLIDNGANVNAIDVMGNTPLLYACEKGLTKVALKLIDKEADVNAAIKEENQKGMTPLHLAIINGLEEVALKLIENEADFKAKDSRGCTPLHYACETGLTKVALKLIDKGAYVNAPLTDKWLKGFTPLHIACEKGLKEVVLKLIENEADVNATVTGEGSQGMMTPLHYACEKNNINIIMLLLENGANPDAKNANGRTPAQLTKNKSKEIIDMLNLISNYIKEKNISENDGNKFIKAQKLQKNVELLLKFKNAISKKQPFKLPERTDKYHDMNVIAEKEKLNGNEDK